MKANTQIQNVCSRLGTGYLNVHCSKKEVNVCIPVEVGIDGDVKVHDLQLRGIIGLMVPEGGQSPKQLEQVDQRIRHLYKRNS